MEQYCTFPMVEKAELFRRVLFRWLVGNEDMHLKNFSIIHREPVIELSLAYDLLNTTIVLANPAEEMTRQLMLSEDYLCTRTVPTKGLLKLFR